MNNDVILNKKTNDSMKYTMIYLGIERNFISIKAKRIFYLKKKKENLCE